MAACVRAGGPLSPSVHTLGLRRGQGLMGQRVTAPRDVRTEGLHQWSTAAAQRLLKKRRYEDGTVERVIQVPG